MKKILVLGGNGFIGGHVVDNLATRGYEVTVFGRLKAPKYVPLKIDGQLALAQSFPKGVSFFFGDIKDREAVNKAVSLCDGAINLAGILGTSETIENPYPSVEVNINGGLNFLQACREYGVPGVQITVGNHFMNNSYAITKTTIERLALMYNKEHGTKIAVVRGLNAYGERQKHAPIRKVIPNLIIPALRKKSIEIFGEGMSVMDMIYVKDLADILVRALVKDHGVYDSVISAGTGRPTTVNFIAELVNELTENNQPLKHIPMRKGEPEKSVVLGDPETLKPLYAGKAPNLTPLEGGLARTIEWYRENYPWQEEVK